MAPSFPTSGPPARSPRLADARLADPLPECSVLLRLLGLLLVVWLALAIIGAVVEGLFWLLMVGVLLFLATAAFGWLKRNDRV
ncbi:DUF7554 family protein [Blastococcus capsensis]|uniref:DUF7554 family protein n=1 Tax=Blastococcus capsensis TaxID=1564163 RepID=UPI00253F770B|nr:hypothetical protein [Blastococcus capsensis]MDK3257879.1 hypothetical protein [Blastococcus capsensis]